MVVLSVTLRLLGVERILDEQGVGLNLSALQIFLVFPARGATIAQDFFLQSVLVTENVVGTTFEGTRAHFR